MLSILTIGNWQNLLVFTSEHFPTDWNKSKKKSYNKNQKSAYFREKMYFFLI